MPHISNLRRSRGYNFEKSIVDWFNSQDGYISRRLGGSSTGLPDIVTTHNETGTIYTIEAKSVTGNLAYIPLDQVERCLDVLKMFDYYKNKWMWFAFKFGINKTNYQGKKNKTNEKTKFYFYKVTLIANLKSIRFVSCNYNGELSLMKHEDSIDTPYMEAWQYTKLNDLLVENASKRTKQATLI